MMKLSEAIRKGIGTSTKAIGVFHTRNGKSRCTIGAGYRGAYGHDYELRTDTLVLMGKALMEITGTDLHGPAPVNIPEEVVKFNPRQLWDVIAALNDYTDWTREQIADWLEGKGF